MSLFLNIIIFVLKYRFRLFNHKETNYNLGLRKDAFSTT